MHGFPSPYVVLELMSYSAITFKDKNPIKRWLQMRRLLTALKLAEKLSTPSAICDFGAGNGELCKLLAARYPNAKIICYEPTPDLLAEAKLNLATVGNIEFCSDIASFASHSVDLVFCLEVFEHLPPTEMNTAMRQIKALLNEHGTAIIGVPVEIGPPALYKGVFRMTRRFGDFDATPKNVFLSFLGLPPKNRPVADITAGAKYHFHHMGFDYRNFQRSIAAEFKLRKVITSPFAILGPLINPEIYFVSDKGY